MFGPKYLSTLFSIAFASHQTGAFLGAWLGGVFYDRFGSYDYMWWLCIAAGLAAAADHWPISNAPVVGASSSSSNSSASAKPPPPSNQAAAVELALVDGGGGAHKLIPEAA
jgi:hypothetical protein